MLDDILPLVPVEDITLFLFSYYYLMAPLPSPVIGLSFSLAAPLLTA